MLSEINNFRSHRFSFLVKKLEKGADVFRRVLLSQHCRLAGMCSSRMTFMQEAYRPVALSSAQARQLSALVFSSKPSSCRRSATPGLFVCTSPGAESAIKPRITISFDHDMKRGDDEIRRPGTGLFSPGSPGSCDPFSTKRPCSVQRPCSTQSSGSAERPS